MSLTLWFAVPASFTTSLVAPFLLKPWLLRLGVIDVPNARSSHLKPTIRGAGIAPLIGLCVGLAISALLSPIRDGFFIWLILAVSVAAASIGWFEDFAGLPIGWRAGAQLLVGIGGAVAAFALAGWSWPLVACGAVFIAAYINVANFMDGVNGISSLHAVVVGGAYAALGAMLGTSWMVAGGLILVAAFLAFLPWNLRRSRVFLGDVGSYLLGASIAIIATLAVASEISFLAVLGPLVIYIADTGFTLVKRLSTRQRWYQPHHSHVYQRLEGQGLRHVQISMIVTVASALTAVLGLFSIGATPVQQTVHCLGMVAVAAVYLALPSILSRSTAHRKGPIGIDRNAGRVE